MTIISVETQKEGSFKVTTDSGEVWGVPDDMTNRHRVMIQEWVDAGGVISPYVAPPPPTDEERIDSAFPQTDTARVIFEVFFEFVNEIRILKDTVNGTTQGAVTKSQFKDYLKTKLP